MQISQKWHSTSLLRGYGGGSVLTRIVSCVVSLWWELVAVMLHELGAIAVRGCVVGAVVGWCSNGVALPMASLIMAKAGMSSMSR